jgi:multiple sugar transport system substrate-binding protein
MRKFMLFVSIVVVFSMLLSACAPAATATSAPKPTDAPKATAVPTKVPTAVPTEVPTEVPAPVEIHMWIMPNGSDPQGMIDVELAAFMAANPDIIVTAEVVGWGDAYGKIQTAAQGGEGPCVTQLGTTWVPTFAAMGGLRPYTADEIAAIGGEAAFVAASWQSGFTGGEVAAMPWFADVRALGYRTDLLEAVGVTPEEAFATMDSFKETLVKIRDAGLVDEASAMPIAAFVHPGKNDWNVWQNASMFIWPFGGDLLSADGTKAAFNSTEAVDALAFYTSLYAEGLTPADTLELNSASAEGRFHDGLAATYFTGPWDIVNSRATGDGAWNPVVSANYGVTEIPAGAAGQFTFVGGSNLGIFKSCANPEAAARLVQYLVSDESQIRYATAVSMLPATLSGQAAFAGDPLFDVFLSAAAKGKTPNPIAQWGAVENNLQTAIQAIWEDVAAAGVGTPLTKEAIKARLDEYAAVVDDLLK